MKFITFIMLILSLLLTVSGKKWRITSTNDCRAALKYENGTIMTYVTDGMSHSFARAKEICEEIGGSLPIIHSQDTLDLLTDVMFPQNQSRTSRLWSSSEIWLGRKTMNSTSCSTEWLDGSPVDFEMQEFGGGCHHECNNTDCCAMYVSANKQNYKKISFGDCKLFRAHAVCVIPGNYISLFEEADSTYDYLNHTRYPNCDLKDRIEKFRRIVSENKSREMIQMSGTPPSTHTESCKSIFVSQDNSNETILIDNRKPGATFNETLKWCNDLGGHLPIIRNFEEYNIIKRTILDLTNSSHLWLGWHPIANTTNCTSSWMDGSLAFNIANFSFLSPFQSYNSYFGSDYYVHTYRNPVRTSSPQFQRKSSLHPSRSTVKLLSSCNQCGYDDCCALQTSSNGATFGSCEENLRKVCIIPGDFMLSQSNPEAATGCNYIDIHDPVAFTTTTTQEPMTGIDIESEDDDQATLEITTMPNEEPATGNLPPN